MFSEKKKNRKYIWMNIFLFIYIILFEMVFLGGGVPSEFIFLAHFTDIAWYNGSNVYTVCPEIRIYDDRGFFFPENI